MYEIQQTRKQIAQALTALYPEEEAEALARILLEEAYQLPYPKLVLTSHKGNEKEPMLREWIARLLQHEPIQYILGKVEFHGMTLKVSKGGLIPRPETELLCQILLDEGWLRPEMIAADLCTGSGAIALFLARYTKQVEAVELSDLALDVAKENIMTLGAGTHIALRRADLLDATFTPLYKVYDLVVSNPPYVLPSEAPSMPPHVREREPEMALFVPEAEPLIFYKAILRHYHAHLREGGRFAFEINPLVAQELEQLFGAQGYKTLLLQDYAGRDRFLIAERK